MKKPTTKTLKKKSVTVKRTAIVKSRTGGLALLIAEVRDLIQSARRGVASVIDTFQVLTNFEIGRRIVEHEQKGEKRAEYGTELIIELSGRLTAEFGRGFSRSNLQNMRSFFLIWQDRLPKIRQQPIGKLGRAEKSQQAIGKLSPIPTSTQPVRKSPFTLSWTHYQVLLTVKDPGERSFYEIEATNSGWSVPELKRQKAACLYERLALSRDKAGIKRLAEKGQIITRPEDLFKEPLVLEFLGLAEQSHYSESDLESALINQALPSLKGTPQGQTDRMGPRRGSQGMTVGVPQGHRFLQTNR